MLFTKQHLGIPVTQLSHHVIILVTRTQANHSCRLIAFTVRDVETPPNYCITYEEAYVCRKGFPSINVRVVCNHNLLLMDVLVKWPGSTHDTVIWNDTNGSSETLGTNSYPIWWYHWPIQQFPHKVTEHSWTDSRSLEVQIYSTRKEMWWRYTV